MLPGPAVLGCCLVSLHFLCFILCSRSVFFFWKCTCVFYSQEQKQHYRICSLRPPLCIVMAMITDFLFTTSVQSANVSVCSKPKQGKRILLLKGTKLCSTLLHFDAHVITKLHLKRVFLPLQVVALENGTQVTTVDGTGLRSNQVRHEMALQPLCCSGACYAYKRRHYP